ncbi:MAG: excinuclease ABC subunit UvrC [Pseudomonadota bacterium]
MTDDTADADRTEERAFNVKEFLGNLTTRPGVYRMIDARGDIIYVGKAHALRDRVSSYFHGGAYDAKTMAMVNQIARIEVTVTNTETEALLLEDNLVKEHKPRYNVLLRDDKSFPYIRVTSTQEFPRLTFHRGPKKKGEAYYGPYPSARSVRETLLHLQKLFQLRQCEDTFFANRSRPCLQYQIKRCSAPCVGLIDADDYARDVKLATLFLQGRNAEVTKDLARRMEEAAKALDYEQAARYRDQIASLKRIEEQQFVADGDSGDFDVIAAVLEGGVPCVAVMFIRAGRNLGTRTWFPRASSGTSATEVIGAFLPQYYLSRGAPPEILVNAEVQDEALLAEVFAGRAGHRVAIRHRVRGRRARWIDMARTNAEQAAQMRAAGKAAVREQLDGLRDLVELDEVPRRIECFDISHTSGEATVASCVVFDEGGPRKSDYRRFNIADVAPGDDYGAMRQALQRRYTRVKRGEAPVPDLLLVDGGKGQVAEAAAVLEDLQLQEIALVGVAKGPTRKAGMEQLHLHPSGRVISPSAMSPPLHLIQQVRDEAHRFAITGHRGRRAKARKTSVLEDIPGLGPKRRKELLAHFGGLQGVVRAGVDDLAKVHGISRKLAKVIYDTFHAAT